MDQLDHEERQILRAYQEGRLESVMLPAHEVERYRKAARRATVGKSVDEGQGSQENPTTESG